MSIKNINNLFKVINNSLFTIEGKLSYNRITDAIIALSNEIDDFDGETESIWSIGEFGECFMDDLLIGAYWHYTGWHDGQGSKSYAALCCLGKVYTPNYDMPNPENFALQQLNILAKQEA